MLTNNFTNCFLLPWVASSPSRYGGEERRDAKPYMLELFSDSVWVSCKVSRRSTSSGFILLNSCLIHSHSRSQISVFLEIHGGWDFGGYEFADRSHLCQAGVAVSCGWQRWPWEPGACHDAAVSILPVSGVLFASWPGKVKCYGPKKLWENSGSTSTAFPRRKIQPTSAPKFCPKNVVNSWWNALEFRAALLKFQTACQFLDSSHCNFGGFGHAGSQSSHRMLYVITILLAHIDANPEGKPEKFGILCIEALIFCSCFRIKHLQTSMMWSRTTMSVMHFEPFTQFGNVPCARGTSMPFSLNCSSVFK